MSRARRRFRPGLVALAVLGCAALLASCSSSSPTAATSTTRPVVVSGGSSTPPGSRTVLDGFREVTVKVRHPDGTVTQHCLLLADTETLRERGLMQVADSSLGGHPGMLFEYQADDEGAFWMKNTLLPLSIAYLRADGTIVSTTDMEPCPAEETSCPSYPAGGPFRYAVEVPKGRLADVGLVDGAQLTVGDRSCPA